MTFYESTKRVTRRTPLPKAATRELAIALLHDHAAFQALQPAVVKSEIISPPAGNSWYILSAFMKKHWTSPLTEHRIVTKASSLLKSTIPAEYRLVTASVSMPFGLKNKAVASTSSFIDTEDGVIVVFQAPMGLYGVNTWHVEVDSERNLELVEEAELTGPGLLMPFIMGKESDSHVEQAKRFAKALERAI